MNIVISRAANKYFYLMNFSGAFDYCRENYNPKYLEMTGQPSKRESDALESFKLWHKKYYVNNPPIQRFIYLVQNEEELFEKFSQTSEAGNLKEIFETMKNSFEKIWGTWRVKLESMASDILDAGKDIDMSKLWSAYNNFFASYQDKAPDEIKVSLIISPVNNGQGAQNIGGVIAIEKNNTNTQESIEQYYLTLAHELIHAHYETKEYRNMIGEYVADLPDTKLTARNGAAKMLRELIVGCLSRGYADELLFGHHVGEEFPRLWSSCYSKNLHDRQNLNCFRYFGHIKLDGLFKRYLESGKSIDRALLKKCWEVIQAYEDATPS